MMNPNPTDPGVSRMEDMVVTYVHSSPQTTALPVERRKFPRYPWTVAVELKTSDQSFSPGTLLNLGRGGGMVETEKTLSEGDLLGIRIGREGEFHPEGIVLLGRTVWCATAHNGLSRYGMGFLRGQRESYEKLMRLREIIQAKSLAERLGLTFVELTPPMAEKRARAYVKWDLASSLNCMPIKLRGERLMVAMADPSDARVLEKLRLFSQCDVVPVVATPSAIRKTLIQSWGAEYVPASVEGSETVAFEMRHQTRMPQITALASATPSLTGRCVAENVAAILNRNSRQVLLADLQSGKFTLSDGVSGISTRKSERVILTLPMNKSTSGLDWAIRANEAILVVSPSHWQKGCFYLESVFDRFVETRIHQGASSRGLSVQLPILEFSVICAEISNIRQGFMIFNRMERRIHHELDMKEPKIDIRLHYLGGILEEKKNFRKAERAGCALTVLKPNSPASQSLNHIAQSLLNPTRERDPRFQVSRPLISRILG